MVTEAGENVGVRLIDMIFPGDTNHHGTLFGGVALAHMDKVAFLTASRHGRAPFVTASCERIDFVAPALKGELIEATGRIVRVGSRSCDVEVDLVAEALLSGERRLCTRGLFTLVAVKRDATRLTLPPVPTTVEEATDSALRMMDMVFPPQTNHYGTLFGGDALRMLGKGAFIAATRATRAVMVMAASASAGISLSLRAAARQVRFVTAQTRAGAVDTLDWASLADPDTTLAFYMGRACARHPPQPDRTRPRRRYPGADRDQRQPGR